MRPKLKISQLTNLHDARYCSAVGIFLQAFTLERENPRKVSVKELSELKTWLSGPEIIGEYGYETPDEIAADQEKLDLDYISVPFDYHPDFLNELPAKVILRGKGAFSTQSDELRAFLDVAALHPEAYLEMELTDLDPELWEALASAGVVERALLNFSNPDPIWTVLQKQGLKPFAFSLGAYVEEEEGVLDYEVCDDLVEKFNELSPA